MKKENYDLDIHGKPLVMNFPKEMAKRYRERIKFEKSEAFAHHMQDYQKEVERNHAHFLKAEREQMKQNNKSPF